MLIFLWLNILAGCCAYLIVYKALRIKGAVDSFIALFVVYLSQVVLIEIVLGIAGALYLKNVIILNFALFLGIYLLTKNRKSSFSAPGLSLYFKRLLKNKLYIFIFSVALSFAITKVLVNLFNPPFGWDSLNYHFTFAVEWLKHGNLVNPITVFDDPGPTYYPVNGSLFFLWLILPFNSVFLADLGQLPFFILALISVYGISRKIGLNQALSFYAAALFGVIPNFFKQLQIAYVDIMVGALILAGINYLLKLDKEFNKRNALIYSLSLGLLIGTKITALPFSILLVIPFIILLFRAPSKASLFLILISCIFIWGGFGFIRNFMDTGNPLYPLNCKLFNIHIFSGVMEKVSYSSQSEASDYSLGKMLFHEGLGPQGPLFILPGVVLALPLALFRRRNELKFSLIYFLCLPFLFYLVWRLVIPLGNLRYLYAFMGMGIILGFYILDTLGVKKIIRDILVALCVFGSMFELAKRQELVASIILTILVFLILINFKRIKIPPKLMLIICALIAFGMLIYAQAYYNANEYSRYFKMVKYSGFWPDATKAWEWLNSNTQGNNIAYAGRPVPFPLYGTGFKNNVYYVSVNKVEPAKLHYFKGGNYNWGGSYEYLHRNLERKGNYREDALFSDWIHNLSGRGIDYLFIYSLHRTKEVEFPIEDSWAKARLDRFELVFTNKMVHIYKVIK